MKTREQVAKEDGEALRRIRHGCCVCGDTVDVDSKEGRASWSGMEMCPDCERGYWEEIDAEELDEQQAKADAEDLRRHEFRHLINLAQIYSQESGADSRLIDAASYLIDAVQELEMRVHQLEERA